MANPSRQVIDLNGAWLFCPDPDHVGGTEEWPRTGLPAGKSREVAVPHTWNVDAGTETYAGTGWYQKRLDVPENWQDSLIRLRFEAVYRDAVVWINGREAYTHAGSGYTRFDVDATPFLQFGATNTITVSADNSFRKEALPYLHYYDWANDGGIIRGVTVIVTGKPAIDTIHFKAVPDLAAGDGSGQVQIKVHPLFCEESASLRGTFSFRITEAADPQTVLLQASEDAVLSAEAVSFSYRFASVKLWHFDHPHLYSLQVTLHHDGKAADTLTVNFGFREIKTAGERIYLNGEPVRLFGVEWMPGSHPRYGMAEGKAQLEQTLRELKDVNCVFTRFHWQQDEALFDWCDRHGMLVQEEIPLWGQPGEPDEAAAELAGYQLRETILHHYNHPSIIAWGVGNELNGQAPQTRAYVREMYRIVKSLDGTRLVNYVSNTLHVRPEQDATVEGDLLMWNEYAGTWFGEMDLSATLDQVHAEIPGKPLVISEWGLCEPAFAGGDSRRIASLREQAEAFRERSFVAGAIYFSYNDYRTHMGEDGEGRYRQRVHGVVDLTGRPKESRAVLKAAASPLTIVGVEFELGQANLQLRANATLPGYTLKGYMLAWERPGEGNQGGTRVHLPDLQPGQQIEVRSPDMADGEVHAAIYRPNGFHVLTVACRKPG